VLTLPPDPDRADAAPARDGG